MTGDARGDGRGRGADVRVSPPPAWVVLRVKFVPRVVSESGSWRLVLPALTVPIAPVTVVAFAVVVAVVAVSAVVMVLTVVVVTVGVAGTLVAVSVVVVVVAALLRACVHGGHVVHSHLGPVAEPFVSYRAR